MVESICGIDHLIYAQKSETAEPSTTNSSAVISNRLVTYSKTGPFIGEGVFCIYDLAEG